MLNKIKPILQTILGPTLYDQTRRQYRRLRYGSRIFPTDLTRETTVPPDPFHKTNPGAFQNFIKAKYERYIGQVENHSQPYFMFLDSTSICQLRCPFCPTGTENAAKKENQPLHFRNRTMMTEELFDHLIEELGERLFFVGFYNWGEPLLNKELPKFIRKAKNLNIHTEIHTNLSLPLSDAFMEELLISGIDEIDASLDGFSQESYATYRRGGNFALVKSNIERLARKRDQLGLKTKIVWNFLVFSFNEHEIETVREYCQGIGIEFNRREAFINIEEQPDWLPSYRKHELKTLKPAVESETGAPAEIIKQAKSPSCSWHYAISVVNADGSVSPCCVPWEQKHDFGMVVPGQVKFLDIWNNDAYQKSRTVFANRPTRKFKDVETLCEHCPYPPDIHNLYVPMELKVIANFWELPTRDAVLERAFKLLDDQTRFVDFCRQNAEYFGITTAREEPV